MHGLVPYTYIGLAYGLVPCTCGLVSCVYIWASPYMYIYSIWAAHMHIQDGLGNFSDLHIA